jgi:GNAT superfamily N-acetyltransferase
MQVRAHWRNDADAIADILAEGWRLAYSDFMPEAFIAPRSDPLWRRAEIAGWLDTDFDPNSEAIFVAEQEGQILGFVHMTQEDKGDLGAAGCVNLLYVRSSAQRRGVGRALMSAGAAWLHATRPGPLVLSAYRDNPYRAAYTALGGREVAEVTHEIAGSPITSVLYLWDDPRRLL